MRANATGPSSNGLANTCLTLADSLLSQFVAKSGKRLIRSLGGAALKRVWIVLSAGVLAGVAGLYVLPILAAHGWLRNSRDHLFLLSRLSRAQPARRLGDGDPVLFGPDADPMPLFPSEDFPGVLMRKVGIGGEVRNGLVTRAPSRLRVRLRVPWGSSLEFGVGVASNIVDRSRAMARFMISQELGGRPSRVLWMGRAGGEPAADGRWVDARLDLSAFAERDVTLLFEAETDWGGAAGEGEYLHAVWSHPRLQAAPAGVKKRHVILISVDTLRADHLGCYGYRRPTSPNIDRLAGHGVVFRNAIAQAPWTTPSHFSLLTSLYPSTHGVNESFSDLLTHLRSPGVRFRTLPPRRVTLAEVFRQAGFETAAFTGGISVAARLGFAQGFDVYDENMGALGSEIHAPLRIWLEGHRDRSFFLFLHTFEVHAPYTGTYFLPEVRSAANAERLQKLGHDVEECAARLVASNRAHDAAALMPMADRLRRRLQELELYQPAVTEALYDGGIRNTDDHLARILERIDTLGIGQDALIVLTSDHGEEFADHHPDRFYNVHGRDLYDELLHVPLILAAPGRLPQGVVSEAQVRLLDVMPTILDWAGLAIPDDVQGESLLPLLRDPTTVTDRPAVAEASLGPYERNALREDGWKYILTRSYPTGEGEDQPEREAPRAEELYDLRADPGEKRNLAAAEGAPTARLRAELRTIIAAARRLRGQGSPQITLDSELREQLRGLGYVH